LPIVYRGALNDFLRAPIDVLRASIVDAGARIDVAPSNGAGFYLTKRGTAPWRAVLLRARLWGHDP
jgi:hypothetical protein